MRPGGTRMLGLWRSWIRMKNHCQMQLPTSWHMSPAMTAFLEHSMWWPYAMAAMLDSWPPIRLTSPQSHCSEFCDADSISRYLYWKATRRRIRQNHLSPSLLLPLPPPPPTLSTLINNQPIGVQKSLRNPYRIHQTSKPQKIERPSILSAWKTPWITAHHSTIPRTPNADFPKPASKLRLSRTMRSWYLIYRTTSRGKLGSMGLLRPFLWIRTQEGGGSNVSRFCNKANEYLSRW